MPGDYEPLITKLKEKLGMGRTQKPFAMNNKRGLDSALVDHTEELHLTPVAAAMVSFEEGSPMAPTNPAYYQIGPLFSDLTADPTNNTYRTQFVNNLFISLCVLDSAYDATEGVKKQFEGDQKTPDEVMKKQAKKAGYLASDGNGDVAAYKNALMTETVDKVAGRATVLGSVLMSSFRGLLYYFRDVIFQLITDYLTADSAITRRGRKLSNFEVLFKDALQRDEITGTAGNSYLVSLIQAETGQREDLAGVAYDGTEFGSAFAGDLDDLR